MAAPLEQFGSAHNPARLRRQIHLARLACDHEGWSRATMLLLLPILVAPILALMALGVTAMRFYDETVADLDTPANMLAAVANYGGAQVYDRNGVLLCRARSDSATICLGLLDLIER